MNYLLDKRLETETRLKASGIKSHNTILILVSQAQLESLQLGYMLIIVYSLPCIQIVRAFHYSLKNAKLITLY